MNEELQSRAGHDEGFATIREYREYQREGLRSDTANQIMWDLRGAFGWRAVAKRDPDTDGVIDWYAVHDNYNRVVVWWPDFFDEPTWTLESIYSFSNPLRDGYAYFTLHEWPETLDKGAQVVR